MISKLMMAVLMVLSAATVCAQSTGEPVENAYQLSRGDKLRVIVYGHEDLSGEFQVDAAGRISMPLIGDVEAENSSLNELEAKIVARLQPDYLKNPQVSAELLSYRPFYVVGEVNSPGSYPFENGMTVINAVALAGGFTYRARKSRIVITRTVNNEVTKIKATLDTVLAPGDSIEVPERFF